MAEVEVVGETKTRRAAIVEIPLDLVVEPYFDGAFRLHQACVGLDDWGHTVLKLLVENDGLDPLELGQLLPRKIIAVTEAKDGTKSYALIDPVAPTHEGGAA